MIDVSKKNDVRYLISDVDVEKLAQYLEARLTKIIESKAPPIPTPDDKLLSIDQTAEFLGVTRQCILNWRKSGKLGYTRIGSRVYFKKSSLLNLQQINLKKG